MNKWVKRKWLRALKSGEYPKGKNVLGIDGGSYCCLGVLACEMIPQFAIQADGRIRVSNDELYLVDDLTELYGLSRDQSNQLTIINDNSDTFAPVINYIEREL